VFQSCRGWSVGDDVLLNVHQAGFKDAVVARSFESSVLAVRVVVEAVP
jgi:predicted aconitase with swiveling domain